MNGMSITYSVSLLPRVWRHDIPQLAAGRGFGVAELSRNFSSAQRQLIVREVRPAREGIRRGDFAPREDLLLLRLVDRVTPGAARRMLDRFSPLPTQLLVALTLGMGRAAGRWDGLVHVGNQVLPLHRIDLVGPGMRRIGVGYPGDSTASEPDDERWSRTRGALGEAVWGKVRSSSVAVVGAGRNGSACAFTMAMLGIHKLVLIDQDVDEWHNLDATIGATIEGIGEPKVENRRRALNRVRPGDLSVATLKESLPDVSSLDHLREVDLIVTAVDHDAPRLTVARWVNGTPHLGKVHLDIGTGVFYEDNQRLMGADIRLLLPGEACVSCLGGLRDHEDASYLASAPPGALPRRPPPTWDQQRAGSLITINQVAVNLGVQMWLDLVAGRVDRSRWCRVEWREDGEPHIQTQTIPDSPCDVCRPGERWHGSKR
jgi:hypothetical protein